MTFLNKETFKCTKCGECCRPRVKVSSEDISRIKELGLKEEEFVDFDEKINSKILLQKNNLCMFLKKGERDEKGEDTFVCSIYDHRPEVCKQYPFIGNEKLEDCRPQGWERWVKIKELVK
tara:strand:- start:1216 stop:1575 length:360 start_codon:yes stop_codon:yes gene_type:complete